jgi:hypothetical protein
MFRFHSHNIHYIVVLVKEAKHFAFIQTMVDGQQEAKCFASIPTIYTIVVLVKEAKHLASTQTMGNVEAKDFASIPTIYTIEYCCVDEQEAKHISLPMGNVEAKGLASIPTIYYCCVDRKRSETSRFHTLS